MRPKGPILPNPQALSQTLRRKEYTGHPGLGRSADPDTWLTPRWILEQLGAFDLDPCAALAAPTHVAANYYTREHDGLQREWSGRVFMNPPFSNTMPWIARHCEHKNGISLLPATCESNIWRSFVWPHAKAVLLLAGRTRFCNPDGSSTTGRPLRPVALVAWSLHDADVVRKSAIAGVMLDHWTVR